MQISQPIHSALEFIHLEEELRRFCQDKPFLWVINPGNWGDALIAAGTSAFLRSRGFAFTAISFRQARKAPLPRLRKLARHDEINFVFSGNGAFLPQYMQTQRLPELVNRCDRMMILPSTFPLAPKKLGLREEDIAFRRDNYGSCDHAPDLPFCHDMAFCLGPISAPPGQGSGLFFRQDSERPKGLTLPDENVDISKQGSETSPITGFLQGLAAYERLYTNRLHVAIGGCLLGREVHLFPNSYFKNEAIYHSSLKGWFDRVHFHQNDALEQVLAER